MKTLTITEGHGRLEYWLKRALRPVEVVSTDYALQEYGLTTKEMATAEKRIGTEIKAARRRGELTRFAGDKDDFR